MSFSQLTSGVHAPIVSPDLAGLAHDVQIQRRLRTLNPINFRTIVPMIADSWR